MTNPLVLAHHEVLIAIEYSLFASGGVALVVRNWLRTRKRQ